MIFIYDINENKPLIKCYNVYHKDYGVKIDGRQATDEEIDSMGFWIDKEPLYEKIEGKEIAGEIIDGTPMRGRNTETLIYNRGLFKAIYRDIQQSQEDIQAQFNIDVDYRLSKLELEI